MKRRIFDSDSHVNEPPHAFEDRLPARLKARGPRIVEVGNGDQAWETEGLNPKVLDSPGSVLANLALKVGGMANVTAEMADEELNKKSKRFENYRPGNYDPAARTEDMDLDGMTASILFPGYALSSLWEIPDSELRVASMRAYNDWLIEEVCAGAPDRLFGLAVIPTGDGMDAAVAELQHSIEKGHKGGYIDCYPDIPLHDPHYDPLWAAAQDLGVPLHWHRANGPSRNIPRGMSAGVGAGAVAIGTGNGGVGGSAAPAKGDQPASVVTRFYSTVIPLTFMLFNGVFQRFPGLKLVSAETDFGWLPFLMQICDDQWDRYAEWYGTDAEKLPSQYIREQFYCTFMDDQVGCSMLDYTGSDNIMWASDYPHGVTTWPVSEKYIEKNLGKRSAEECEKILWSNAWRLYGSTG